MTSSQAECTKPIQSTDCNMHDPLSTYANLYSVPEGNVWILNYNDCVIRVKYHLKHNIELETRHIIIVLLD